MEKLSQRAEETRRIFGKITIPAVSEDILRRIAVSAVDPYYAAIQYAIYGEGTKGLSYLLSIGTKPPASRTDCVGIEWQFGRAIHKVLRESKGGLTIKKLAESLGYDSDYNIRTYYYAFKKYPLGVPDEIKNTRQLMEDVGNAKKCREGQEKEAASVWRKPLDELTEIALKYGRPLKNEEIDAVAIKHNVSPNTLKNKWALRCKETLLPSARDVLVALSKKVEEYEKRLAEYEKTISENEKQKTQYEEKISQLEQKIQTVEQTLSSLKTSLMSVAGVFSQLAGVEEAAYVATAQ